MQTLQEQEGIEPTEQSSLGETSRAKKKSKTADFCTGKKLKK